MNSMWKNRVSPRLVPRAFCSESEAREYLIGMIALEAEFEEMPPLIINHCSQDEVDMIVSVSDVLRGWSSLHTDLNETAIHSKLKAIVGKAKVRQAETNGLEMWNHAVKMLQPNGQSLLARLVAQEHPQKIRTIDRIALLFAAVAMAACLLTILLSISHC